MSIFYLRFTMAIYNTIVASAMFAIIYSKGHVMRYGKDMSILVAVMGDESLKRHEVLVTEVLENVTNSVPQPIDSVKLGELAEIWGMSKSVTKQVLRDDYAYILRSAKELKGIHGRIKVENRREPITTAIQTMSWLIESVDAIEV